MPQRASRLTTRKPITPRESAAVRGYDRDWQKARLHFLAKHPLCVACRAAGKVTPAEHVDHIRRHRGQSDPLFWDRSNWQALCASCHSKKTAEEARHGEP